MLNLLKSSRILFVFIFTILFIIPGCGGGGSDGDGGGGTPAPTVPTVINYSVGSSTMTPLLTGTAAGGMTFSVTHLDLAGSYNRNTNATTLLENRGMSFHVSATPAVLGGGEMTIGITTPAGSTAQWVSGSNPTAGKFLVTVTARDQITVQVNSGGTGVDISVNSVPIASPTWAEFVGAVETSVVSDVVLASLAYNAIQTVYRCVSQVYTLIEVVMENQDTLTQSGIDVQLVTSLPGYPSNIHVQWGGNGSGNISPGDNFLSRFSNWWMDNPGSNKDYFYNGRLLWLDYWEGTNSSGNFVGGDFKIGVSGDAFYEEEVDNSGNPDTGTRMTYQESGFLFLLNWQ
jgi:hypothetical protein